MDKPDPFIKILNRTFENYFAQLIEEQIVLEENDEPMEYWEIEKDFYEFLKSHTTEYVISVEDEIYLWLRCGSGYPLYDEPCYKKYIQYKADKNVK